MGVVKGQLGVLHMKVPWSITESATVSVTDWFKDVAIAIIERKPNPLPLCSLIESRPMNTFYSAKGGGRGGAKREPSTGKVNPTKHKYIINVPCTCLESPKECFLQPSHDERRTCWRGTPYQRQPRDKTWATGEEDLDHWTKPLLAWRWRGKKTRYNFMTVSCTLTCIVEAND